MSSIGKIVVNNHGLEINTSGKTPTTLTVNWSDINGIFFPLFRTTPFLRYKDSKKLAIPLTTPHFGKFIQDFYTTWLKKNPERARKNAFDYSESPFALVGLIASISIFLCFLLSGTLAHEVYTQNQCSKAFAENSVVQEAEVVKLKKKQQGNYAVTARFRSSDGKIFEGKRFTMTTYSVGAPDPEKFSVIYAASAPHCWTISEAFGKNDINWAKRRYTEAFNSLMALTFFITGVLGILFTVLRLQVKRPYRQEIAAQLNI